MGSVNSYSTKSANRHADQSVIYSGQQSVNGVRDDLDASQKMDFTLDFSLPEIKGAEKRTKHG